MTRRLPSVLLATAVAAIAAAPAFAKEGVEATLATPVPLDAAQGEEITLAWTLASVDEQGTVEPFGAQGVFVQLESASGGEPTVGFAGGDGGRNGQFEAVVVVPKGGIGGIVIGLGGTVSDTTGTRPSPVYFPVTNNPLPAVSDPTLPDATPVDAAPAPEPPESPSPGWGVWIAALALALLVALGGLGLLARRRRHAAAAG